MSVPPMRQDNPLARIRAELDAIRRELAAVRSSSRTLESVTVRRGGITLKEGARITSVAANGSATRLADGAAQVQLEPGGDWLSLEEVILEKVPTSEASDGQPPVDAPANIAAEPFSVGAIELSWLPVTTNADPILGYDVQVASGEPIADEAEMFRAGGTRAVVAQLAAAALPPDAPVFMRVRAVDADGAGPWSSVVSATPRLVDFDLVADEVRDDIEAADAKAVAAQAEADAATAAAVAAAQLAQSAQNVADDAIRTWYQEDAPTGPNDTTDLGDLWFKQSTGVAYRWAGTGNGGWVVIPDAAATAALAAASAAQATADAAATAATQAVTTANGKNRNTAGPTSSPSTAGRVEGDIHWTRTDGKIVRVQQLTSGAWLDQPISVEVLAGLDAAYVNTLLLSADTILARIIAAEEITAEMVAANFLAVRTAEIVDLIASRIRSEINEVGDSMILNGPASTITVWKDASRGEILFQVGPGGAVSRVPMDTDGISAMGAVILKNIDSQIAAGGGLTVESGVSDPSQKVTLSTGPKAVANWPAVSSSYRVRGVAWDAAAGVWLRLLVPAAASAIPGGCIVQRISATTHLVTSSVTLGDVGIAGSTFTEADVNGIVRVGDHYYSMVRRSNISTPSTWYLVRWVAAGGAWNLTAPNGIAGVSGRPAPGVGQSGNPMSVHVHGDTGHLRLAGYDAADLSVGFAVDFVTNWSGSHSLLSYDESGVKGLGIPGAWKEGALVTAVAVHAWEIVFGVGTQRRSTYDRGLTQSVALGGADYRPAVGWHAYTSEAGILELYSDYRNPGSHKAWASYTNRSATATTLDSPVESILVPNNHFVLIEVPSMPAGVTEQWVYMGLGTTQPSDANLKKRPEALVGRRVAADPAVAGGAAVPSSNTFPAGGSGWVKSKAEPGWKGSGDGTFTVRDPQGDYEAVNKRTLDKTVSEWTTLTGNHTVMGVSGVTLNAGSTLSWRRIGDVIEVEFYWTTASAATGTIVITPPKTPRTPPGPMPLGNVVAQKSATRRYGMVRFSGSSLAFSFENATPAEVNANASAPFASASGDVFTGRYSYRTSDLP